MLTQYVLKIEVTIDDKGNALSTEEKSAIESSMVRCMEKNAEHYNFGMTLENVELYRP